MSSPAVPLPSTLHALQRRADNKRFAELEADLMPTLNQLRLDLTRTTYVGRKGDLTAWLTDIDLPARKRQPALLLANAANPKERHVHVLLNELWVVLEHHHNREIILQMAERLYGFVTQQNVFRILDALFDFAEDLKNAKPPRWMTHAQWLQALAEDDMTFTFNGHALNR